MKNLLHPTKNLTMRIKESSFYRVLFGGSFKENFFEITQFFVVLIMISRIFIGSFTGKIDEAVAYSFTILFMVIAYMGRDVQKTTERQRDDLLDIAQKQQAQIVIMETLLKTKGFSDLDFKMTKVGQKEKN